MGKTLLFITILSAGLVASACCTTTDTAAVDDQAAPAVATAGWESVPPPATTTTAVPAPPPAVGLPVTGKAAAGGDDMESLRAANRKLMDQVAKLRGDIQSAKTERTAAPAPVAVDAVPAAGAAPVPSPDARPVASPERLRRALQTAGATDLVVGTTDDGLLRITLPSSLSFASGRAELNESAKGTIRTLGAVLNNEMPGTRLRIEGHTDSDPIRKSGWESNEALSAARAQAVAACLTSSSGIAADRVRANGYGAARPVASNATPAGKAANRRVEIILVP